MQRQRTKVKDFVSNGLTISHMVLSDVKPYALDRLNVMCIICELLGFDTVANEDEFSDNLYPRFFNDMTVTFELVQIREIDHYQDTDDAFTIIAVFSVMETIPLDSITVTVTVTAP